MNSLVMGRSTLRPIIKERAAKIRQPADTMAAVRTGWAGSVWFCGRASRPRQPGSGGPGCGRPGGDVGGEGGQLRVGPRGERLGHPRVELVFGQLALDERGLERLDHVVAVGVARPDMARPNMVTARYWAVVRACHHQYLPRQHKAGRQPFIRPCLFHHRTRQALGTSARGAMIPRAPARIPRPGDTRNTPETGIHHPRGRPDPGHRRRPDPRARNPPAAAGRGRAVRRAVPHPVRRAGGRFRAGREMIITAAGKVWPVAPRVS